MSRDGAEFEYDEGKSRSNRANHCIDFVEAQDMWLDPELTMVKASTGHEERWVVIGKIEGKHWAAVVTHRGGMVRLISVRRARRKEVLLYESR